MSASCFQIKDALAEHPSLKEPDVPTRSVMEDKAPAWTNSVRAWTYIFLVQLPAGPHIVKCCRSLLMGPSVM